MSPALVIPNVKITDINDLRHLRVCVISNGTVCAPLQIEQMVSILTIGLILTNKTEYPEEYNALPSWLVYKFTGKLFTPNWRTVQCLKRMLTNNSSKEAVDVTDWLLNSVNWFNNANYSEREGILQELLMLASCCTGVRDDTPRNATFVLIHTDVDGSLCLVDWHDHDIIVKDEPRKDTARDDETLIPKKQPWVL